MDNVNILSIFIYLVVAAVLGWVASRLAGRRQQEALLWGGSIVVPAVLRALMREAEVIR